MDLIKVSDVSSVFYYRPQRKVIFSEACVSHCVHNRPHGYLFIAHPCYGAVGTHPTGMFYVYLDALYMYVLGGKGIS